MALPKEPRQLMINLMYLVLTAMLALNITKEVLTAFQTITTSIDASNTSISGKNANFITQFNNAFNNPDQKEKVRALRNNALQVDSASSAMYAYLESWKDSIVRRSGGWEIDRDGQKAMKGLDDIVSPTELFVDEKRGDDIKAKLNNYKANLIKLVSDAADVKKAMSKQLPIQLADMVKNEDNPTGDWSFGTFHNIPVVAAVAMLSKYQNDVKNSESIVLEHLYGQIGINEWKFDEVTAMATPTTSYALEGQDIEATIILGAYNKNLAVSMGPGVVVKDGVGTLKFKATGVGEQTKSGEINVFKDGVLKHYPYKFSYMVGTQGASLQLDKMNVMYIGVPNPITLSASGYNIEDVLLSMPGATVTSAGKGHYVAEVTSVGKIEYTISAKPRAGGGGGGKIIGGEIRVKNIPDPTARIGGKTGGLMPTATAKAQIGVAAQLDGFDFDARFLVTSFTFTYWPKVGDPVSAEVTGNRFNGECATLIQRSKPGDRWVFSNIRAVGPDKHSRSLNPILLYLN